MIDFLGDIMKHFLAAFVLTLMPLAGFAATPAQLEEDFLALLEIDLQESFAEIEQMQCDPTETGILCAADLLIIDVVAHGSSSGGGEYRCSEVYSYQGGEEYVIEESDCL